MFLIFLSFDFFSTCPEEIVAKIKRVLSIWEDRQVFPAAFIKGILASDPKTNQHMRSPLGADKGEPRTPEVEEDAFSERPAAVVRSNPQDLQLADLLPGIDIPQPTADTLHELIQLLTEQKGIEEKTQELKTAVDALGPRGVEDKLAVLRKGDLTEISSLNAKIDQDKELLREYQEHLEQDVEQRQRVQALLASHLEEQRKNLNNIKETLNACKQQISSNDVIQQKAQQRLDPQAVNKTTLGSRVPATKRSSPQNTTSFSEYNKRARLNEEQIEPMHVMTEPVAPQVEPLPAVNSMAGLDPQIQLQILQIQRLQQLQAQQQAQEQPPNNFNILDTMF